MSLPGSLFKLKPTAIPPVSQLHLLDYNAIPPTSTASTDSDSNSQDTDDDDPQPLNPFSCNTCPVQHFPDVMAQRNHFQSDWHVLNLRRRLHNEPPVTEDEVKLVPQDHDPASESETSDPAVTKQSPTIGFRMENDMRTVYTVYRVIVPGPTRTDLHSALSQISCIQTAYLMLGGGHFACAIFNADSVTHHTSIHRYTTRRKQGGAQSSQDATKRSAGASLRRYNEAQLARDVWNVMAQWRAHLMNVHLVFVVAPGVLNRNTLFQDGFGLDKADPRVRRVPFSTRRPGYTEILRIHKRMFSVSSHPYVEPAPVVRVAKPTTLAPTTPTKGTNREPRSKKKKTKKKPNHELPKLSNLHLSSDDEHKPDLQRLDCSKGVNRLGSGTPNQIATVPSIVQEMDLLGLSVDQRRTLEREQRARAAERRLGIQSPAMRVLRSAPSMRPASEQVAESIATGVSNPASSSNDLPNGPPCTLCGKLTGKSALRRPNGIVFCGIQCAAKAKRK